MQYQVLVVLPGKYCTSTDGEIFTKAQFNTTQTLRSVAYGNGITMVIGYNGLCVTSTDLKTWTSRQPPVVSYYSVSFINGRFYLAGDDGTVVSSIDGAEWTTLTTGTTDDLKKITFCNNQFVLFKQSSIFGLLFSNDGSNWIKHSNRFFGTINLNAIAYGVSRYILVGSENTIISIDAPSISGIRRTAKELKKETFVKFYNNSIKFENSFQKKVKSVNVYTILGKLVYRENIKNIKSIYLNTLSPGLYIVKITTSGNDGKTDHIALPIEIMR
jgi:hypothetical protein